MKSASDLFRLLADGTRLRMLRVLAQDRFNVGELTAILGMAQSGVSRHLGLLKEYGLVSEQREGGYAYYRLADQDRNDGQAPLWALLDSHFAASAGDTAVREDEARLQEIRRHRKENFETHGDVRQLVPGRSWAAWARALGHLLPPLDVADVGCGEGYLTLELARWARTVYGIDRSEQVLDQAKSLASRRNVVNVEWRMGELTRLPLHDASVDVVLLSQALHHAADPEQAVTEAVRILRPGGRLLVLDLRDHEQQWVRVRFGDQHLGFTDAALERLLRDAGLAHVRVQVGARHAGDPFVVLIASGAKHGPDAGPGGSASQDPPYVRASGAAERTRGLGPANLRGPDVADGRGPGSTDVRRPSAADGRGPGVADGRRPGTADVRRPAAAERSREPGVADVRRPGAAERTRLTKI